MTESRVNADPQRVRTVTWGDPGPTAARGREVPGFELLSAIGAGELPWPPVHQLLGFEGESFGEGRVCMSFLPAEYHYNPLGVVHGGVTTTILDSVMGCAVQSKLAAGEGYTTLDINVSFVRAVTIKTGRVRAVGEVIHLGRRVATAKAELLDLAGKLYAHATTTCLILRPEAGGKERA
jgi:uncharacterized protein (TIGR00369 family)